LISGIEPIVFFIPVDANAKKNLNFKQQIEKKTANCKIMKMLNDEYYFNERVYARIDTISRHAAIRGGLSY
jgi:hypothetical protein